MFMQSFHSLGLVFRPSREAPVLFRDCSLSCRHQSVTGAVSFTTFHGTHVRLPDSQSVLSFSSIAFFNTYDSGSKRLFIISPSPFHPPRRPRYRRYCHCTNHEETKKARTGHTSARNKNRSARIDGLPLLAKEKSANVVVMRSMLLANANTASNRCLQGFGLFHMTWSGGSTAI